MLMFGICARVVPEKPNTMVVITPAATAAFEIVGRNLVLADLRSAGEVATILRPSSSLRLPNATRDYVSVYEQFFARLSANCFSSCSCLCRLDRIFKHQFSNLMFDGDCRRKFDFSSEPVFAHWALLWPSTLDRYALGGAPLEIGHDRRCLVRPRPIATAAPPHLRVASWDECQVSKKAGACSGLLYSQ
jgi:hypothetical protein